MIVQSQGASVCSPTIQHGFICTDCFNLLNRIIPLYLLLIEFVERVPRAGYEMNRPTVYFSGVAEFNSEHQKTENGNTIKNPKDSKEIKSRNNFQSIGSGTSPPLENT